MTRAKWLGAVVLSAALTLAWSPAAQADPLEIRNDTPVPIFVSLNAEWPDIAQTSVDPFQKVTVDVNPSAPSQTLRVINQDTGQMVLFRAIYIERYPRTLVLYRLPAGGGNWHWHLALR